MSDERNPWGIEEEAVPAIWSGRGAPAVMPRDFGCAHCGRCPKCGREIGEHKRRSNFGTPGYELVCPLVPAPAGGHS